MKQAPDGLQQLPPAEQFHDAIESQLGAHCTDLGPLRIQTVQLTHHPMS